MTALQLLKNGVHGFKAAFHVVNRVVGEAHLELAVENLELGADFVHRAFVHLHHVHEFVDLVFRQRWEVGFAAMWAIVLGVRVLVCISVIVNALLTNCLVHCFVAVKSGIQFCCVYAIMTIKYHE